MRVDPLLRGAAVALAIAIMASAASAADRFVSVLGSDAANTCLTSTAPCLTMAYALDQAASGDVIKAARGRYDESLLINASTVVTFSGSWEPDFASRDAAAHSTKLLRVLQVDAGPGETIDVTIDGFLMTREGGLSASSHDDAALTVRFVSTAVDRNRSFPPIVANASGASTLDLEFTNSTVSSNRITLGGTDGTIVLSNSGTSVLTLTMTDSAVEKNFGPFFGKYGIRAGTGAELNVSLTRTRFSRHRGDAVRALNVGVLPMDLTLDDATITGNGGGIAWSGGNVTVVNSVIARNRGTAIDIGTHALDALLVVNSTIRGNRSSCDNACSAGMNLRGGTADLRNTILWGNRAARGPAQDLWVDAGATVNVDHCDLGDAGGSGYNDLGGNIDADPLHESRRDDHLTAASPAIDAGTCTGAPATDFDGDPRPAGATCDIGADEF